jgi:hypothetical protein
MSTSEELDPERAQIMRAVRQASTAWAEAMQAHKLAPPDAGFSARLRTLSEAAKAEQVTWEHAHAAGLLWRPVPGAENAEPPYELRRGTGRRGPQPLWEQFDAAVSRLNQAIASTSAADVADAFGEISAVTAALADAVAEEDAETADSRLPRRARGAA